MKISEEIKEQALIHAKEESNHPALSTVVSPDYRTGRHLLLEWRGEISTTRNGNDQCCRQSAINAATSVLNFTNEG